MKLILDKLLICLLLVSCDIVDRPPKEVPILFRAGQKVEIIGGFYDRCTGYVTDTYVSKARRYDLKLVYCGNFAVDRDGMWFYESDLRKVE